MINNPKVSILIPVYNRVKIIQEAIDSALNQTYQNIEIIISDNNSTDGTRDILKNYKQIDSRVRIILNNENKGPVINWNKCLEVATGDFAMFLWSDDLLEKGVVERSLNYFSFDVSFVISQYAIFENSKIIYKSKFQKSITSNSQEVLKDILIYQVTDFPFSPAGALFRLEELRNNLKIKIENNLDLCFEKYGAGNDLLIFALTLNSYKKVYCINEIGVFFRKHPGSITVSNNLFKYYEFSRLYFVLNYKPEWKTYINTKYFIKRLFSKNYNIFYWIIQTEDVKAKPIKFIFNWFIRKFNTYL